MPGLLRPATGLMIPLPPTPPPVLSPGVSMDAVKVLEGVRSSNADNAYVTDTCSQLSLILGATLAGSQEVILDQRLKAIAAVADAAAIWQQVRGGGGGLMNGFCVGGNRGS
jgi:hypothetical protein